MERSAERSAKHGEERNRQIITDRSDPVELEDMTTGRKFSMSMSSHTYSQAEKFCKTCGWVTCKGIVAFIVCPSCHGDW